MNTKSLDDQSLHDADIEMEIWSAGEGESYVYTNSWPMVRALKKRFGQGAEYIRDGVILAWQFRIPGRLVEMLKRNFRKFRRSGIDEGTLTEELVRAEEAPGRPES